MTSPILAVPPHTHRSPCCCRSTIADFAVFMICMCVGVLCSHCYCCEYFEEEMLKVEFGFEKNIFLTNIWFNLSPWFDMVISHLTCLMWFKWTLVHLVGFHLGWCERYQSNSMLERFICGVKTEQSNLRILELRFQHEFKSYVFYYYYFCLVIHFFCFFTNITIKLLRPHKNTHTHTHT